MKKIIIPTDFSIDSIKTIDHVLDKFQDTDLNINLVLLNTYIVQQTDPKLVIHLNDKMKTESKNNMENLRQETLKKISNPLITVSTACQLGSLKNVLLQFMNSQNIDHVAVSRKMAGDLRSISEVLQEKKCSFIIP